MRVVVNMTLCESNALCMGIVPEVFDLPDDDILVVLDEEPDEALRPRLQQAVASCPKQAIRLDG